MSFKQYIPLKAAKFGIKSYELCECSTGYVWFFIIYTRQGMELTNQFVNSDTNKTAAIVFKLVEPLLGHGHTLWMDSFYISPELARFLKLKKTDCVSTLHVNRKKCSSLGESQKTEKGRTV
jgi:hypothetical protein